MIVDLDKRSDLDRVCLGLASHEGLHKVSLSWSKAAGRGGGPQRDDRRDELFFLSFI